jgi:hypothetical protein
MPFDRLVTDNSGQPDGRGSLVWILPVAFLVGVWLWLVFYPGDSPAENWVFPVLATGVAGLAVSCLVTYPRRPRQLSLAVLALLTGYALWLTASSLWAGSASLAWLASARTLGYLLVLSLALTYFTSPVARAAFRYLLIVGAFVLLLVSIVRIWSVSDATTLFVGNRLAFPLGRPDAAAALFLISFWPLIWLAAGPDERAPVRGIALGIATGLLGLALMTQSRSAAWSMAVTLLLLFVLSPGRVRMLLYLVVPGLLMVYAFPMLNGYWTQGAQAVAGGSGARALTVAVVASAFIGTILALLEGWIKVTRRMRAIFGVVVIAACAAGIIYGAVSLTQEVGGPGSWLRDAWRQLITEPATGEPSSQAVTTGSSSHTREAVWKLTWEQIEARRVVGTGGDNSGVAPATRVSPGGTSSPPQHANTATLQVLADTGIVGGVLAFGALILCMGGMLWPRLAVGWQRAKRAGRRERAGPPGSGVTAAPARASRWGGEPLAYGWQMALFTGAAYWFVEANMQGLWPLPAVTVPALLMVAAGLADTDARAGTLWPRFARRWTYWPPEPAPGTPSAAPGPAPVAAPGAASRLARRGRLRPPGPLSQVFRVGLIVLSAAVIIATTPVYLLVLR